MDVGRPEDRRGDRHHAASPGTRLPVPGEVPSGPMPSTRRPAWRASSIARNTSFGRRLTALWPHPASGLSGSIRPSASLSGRKGTCRTWQQSPAASRGMNRPMEAFSAGHADRCHPRRRLYLAIGGCGAGGYHCPNGWLRCGQRRPPIRQPSIPHPALRSADRGRGRSDRSMPEPVMAIPEEPLPLPREP